MKKWISIFALLVMLAPFGLAQNPPITKTLPLKVTVQTTPDFTMTLSIVDITTYPNRTIGFVSTVTAVGTFAGDVTITTTGLPAGWTVTPTPATGKVTLGPDAPKGVSWMIVIPAGQATGIFNATVKAESTNYN